MAIGIEQSINRIKNSLILNKTKHYRMFDYIPMYEKIYPIGYKGNEASTFRNHKFFYPNDIQYNTETIIVWHTLNAEERKKILGIS